MFGSNSTPLGALSSQQALELANLYLDNAYNISDPAIALVLCHDTKGSLSHAKKVAGHHENQVVNGRIATAYIDLGALLKHHRHDIEAQTIYKKAEKLGGNVQNGGRPTRSFKQVSHLVDSPQDPGPTRLDIITIPAYIFADNVRPPVAQFKLPEADERLSSTPQLVGCLELLQTSHSPNETMEPVAEKWLQAIEKDTDEQDRLRTMATGVIRVFKQDELQDAKAVAEVVYLAPVLDKDIFRNLLAKFCSGIGDSILLKPELLEGLAQLIQGAKPGHLDADDLVKILELLSDRLRGTHQQSFQQIDQLTLAVSRVLDAMADTRVTGLDREKLHEPLSEYLRELKESPDPYLVYQAAYAYQALLCVPDNESKWQAAARRAGKVIQGVSGLVGAVKGFDLNKFIEGLGDIQTGFEGMSQAVEFVKSAYDDVSSLAEGGKGFMDCLKEGLSFDLKRDWYSALRGADVLIRDGELATFKELACKAPCRLDPAFQWGVCQRLGVIAVNPAWSTDTRRDAIAFLGEIYRNDKVWGRQTSVKKWILNILMQLSASSGTGFQLHAAVAESMLKELEESEDEKHLLYQACKEKGSLPYPLMIPLPELASPSLLDRVQNVPDVEANVRLLKKRRAKEPGNIVYIPPQAKSSLNANDKRVPLMETVKEFLESNQKVLLIHGDSGSGKSTFNRELEIDLWRSYKKNTGRIPLHINLPAIDKPEHEMIAKQLRRAEFTEAQIREMKRSRSFILICDGYDESQQTHNLYVSNQLNQPEEWKVQMVISCRTEYLGTDYRYRFQPGDRNDQTDSSLFQEAEISSFSTSQVQAYIQQYVSVHQPIWHVEDYKQALEDIPSLNDLMTNPFLMSLSLEVLPRIADPGHFSTTQVTKVGLYDHFVEQWLERGKKRIGETDLTPQARAIFDRLSSEGFTQNGISFLKKLAVAIYKEQDGHPVVEYSQAKHEGSWKDAFFLRSDKQLLREACPLRRNGNQHRFIHRSLLEYGLTRAIFDPQDVKERMTSDPATSRRGSVSSTWSFEVNDSTQESAAAVEQEPDIDSPLVWRSFVNDYSLLQFLEERVPKEPMLKQQLLTYIEYSKKDKKWRIAAANAITVLVRAGVQFIGADLRGIQIPGADLSHGVFDSADLQEADLRKVHLRGTWLRQTNLGRALMTSVQFGELPFLEEDSAVYSCTYSPDGKSFATGLQDGNITVYATSRWERIRSLSGHSGTVRRATFSPNGNLLASASMDMTVRLWDVETGSLQRIFIGHTWYVYWVAYSPQGDQIASASADGTVRLWDVAAGKYLQALQGHNGEVVCVAYSPNGQKIASCGTDGTVRVWDVETGDYSHILSGHTGLIWAIAFSPQGDQIASVGIDANVLIWDAETGNRLFTQGVHLHSVNSIAYSPKGDQVVTGSADAILRLWDSGSEHCLQTMSGHAGIVRSVAYSRKGDQVASGSDDNTVRLWDVSATVSRFVSGGHSSAVGSIKYSPRGDRIATCSSDRTIRLWDTETGSCHGILTGHENSVFGVTYSPEGDRLASGSSDTTVRLWDVDTGTCLHTFTGHTNYVQDVAYSPQGDVIASASDDTTVRLWNVATGECFRTLSGHDGGVRCITYSPNGTTIASGSEDSTARIWDAESGECIQVLKGHSNWVRDVAYSPQGNQLATAGYDNTIRLWDVETGECRVMLVNHDERVSCVAYSRHGNLLASGSWDETVRIWDVATGECRAVIENLQGTVFDVAWSTTSDKDYLFIGCQDGSVLKWEITNEGEQSSVCLRWSATNGMLNTMGASIQDVRGLTLLNKQLLEQRGAIGEPIHRTMKEPGKKVLSMVSVVSKLKQPAESDSSSTTSFPMEQPEQQDFPAQHPYHT